jgi:hypothetical protein
LSKKNLNKEKNTAMIWVVTQDARIVLLKKALDFVREGERGIEIKVLTYLLFI